MIMAILEGIAKCFVLLIICVIGITEGPVGMVVGRRIDGGGYGELLEA